jgi:hypothetical protein
LKMYEEKKKKWNNKYYFNSKEYIQKN